MEAVSELTQLESANWRVLFRLAGTLLLTMVAFIVIQIAVFIIWPPPGDAAGWFELFQMNKLVGLLDMDLLLIVDQVFMGIILVALYIALRRANKSLMTVSLTLGLTGVITYFSSAVAFEMMSLSDRYASAVAEGERAILLAAGQAMLATWQGTAFNVGYVIEGIAFLLMGTVMLRSAVFGRLTAWVSIVLGIMSLVPPTVTVVGMYFALGSLIPLVMWDFIVAGEFFRLAKS